MDSKQDKYKENYIYGYYNADENKFKNFKQPEGKITDYIEKKSDINDG